MYAKTVIDLFAKNQTASNMDSVIQLARNGLMTDDEIAYLATKLAKSGKQITVSKQSMVADIPSTGGASSLSTLICPLVLIEFGFVIPKLGIKGRPAGGIDVLYQIPNYNVTMRCNEIENILINSKYCHFNVSEHFAPLDAKLFQYRSKVGAKSIAPLVIASILSKKIVTGLKITGLDVRVSKSGNFGSNYDEAESYSKRFIKVAKKVGISAKCFLNDFNVIQQPYIGRGESLIALQKVFENNMDNMLKKHVDNCICMSLELLHGSKLNEIVIDKLAANFENNLISQGSSLNKFQKRVQEIESLHIYNLKADKDGFLNIDLGMLRDMIVEHQNKVGTQSLFPDPCGVIFKKTPYEYIQKGEIVCTYRITKEFKLEFSEKLIKSYCIVDTPYSPINMKIIK